MNAGEVQKKQQLINQYIVTDNLYWAFEELKALASNASRQILLEEIVAQEEIYVAILRHISKGIHDPQRQTVYHHLQRALLKISDTLFALLITECYPQNMQEYYILFSKPGKKEQLFASLEDIVFGDILHVLTGGTAATIQRKELFSELFHFIFLSSVLCDDEQLFYQKLIISDKVYKHEKAMLVSALSLSCQRFFDEKKILLLVNCIEEGNKEIAIRAMTGLIICLYQYDNRLFLYPACIERLNILFDDANRRDMAENLFIQLYRSADTEKIIRKLQDEILPEVQKMQPKIIDHLQLDNLFNESQEGAKPEWEKIFSYTPQLYNKLEELSKLQIEGADVFMHPFSMLKHFDFFHVLSNWFLPFYPEHDIIREMIASSEHPDTMTTFVQHIADSPFLCNSDKYSMCLNLKNIPPMQQKMMVNMFDMELGEFNAMAAEEEKLYKGKEEKKIFIQYMQDLYRFYQLHPLKDCVFNIFSSLLFFHRTFFYRFLQLHDNAIKNIADFVFVKERYAEAGDMFAMLNEKNRTKEYTEKIAWCKQKTGFYMQAVDVYLEVEFFDRLENWHLKNIAYCLLKDKKPEKALPYLLHAEELDANDKYTLTSLAQCYVELRDYEKAISYYYKLDFTYPGNTKIIRALAYCCLMLEKYDEAIIHYTKIQNDKSVTIFDIINKGHATWLKEGFFAAFNIYKQTMIKMNNDEKFKDLFLAEKEFLLAKKITPEDFSFMINSLFYKQSL